MLPHTAMLDLPDEQYRALNTTTWTNEIKKVALVFSYRVCWYWEVIVMRRNR